MSQIENKKPFILTHIAELLTMQGARERKARGPLKEEHLGVAKNQAMVVQDKKVLWVGPQKKIPREYHKIKKQIAVHSNLFPGFIDCHTHSLFAGDRTQEFEMRLQGMSYAEIAKKGGGIFFTMRATRAASSSVLKKSLEERLQVFLKQGVTTVEVKSGYGLSVNEEVRLLKILKQQTSPVTVISTFLGAHALPPECSSASEYLEQIQKALPMIAKQKLAKRVDIFIEKNYFSVDEGRKFLKLAQDCGLSVTIHADQLTRTGATSLAIDLKAQSADHVICIDQKDIEKAALSEMTCVLLPTADFYLKCPYPPARQLIERGARVALATDFNPGTSPTQNIQWVGLLARQEMRMSLPEVFCAMTVGAAYALGLENSHGFLQSQAQADFFIVDKNWDQFFYDLSPIPMQSVWVNGLFNKV
jgi:imidazolonepropionase